MNQGEEKTESANISSKSRSKLRKSDESNNAANEESHISQMIENHKVDMGEPNVNSYENNVVTENQIMQNSNNINSNINNNFNYHNKDKASDMSMNKIMQHTDNNLNSNINNSFNFNANQAKHSYPETVNNSNNSIISNNKNSGQQAHISLLGKRGDNSFVDITSASRVITAEDVKNAPMLTLEVFLLIY